MTVIQKAKKYLKETPQYVMDENDTAGYASRLVRDLMLEITCLKIQVCDRGKSFQKAAEKNKQLRATLKEVSGCFENHGGPKLCEGCLISIGDALAE